MIWNRLFGGEAPAASGVAVVRDITIGRQVRLDPLAWRRLAGAAFTLDRDTLEISAQGIIKLDEGGYVHRFYTDDELMLQAVSQRADGADADDFTLFRPWTSTYPAGPWDTSFDERLRRPAWDEPGLPPFARFWYPGDDREQPPVQLWEAVHWEREAPPVKHVRQRCMLYAREVGGADGGGAGEGGEGQELLLAIAMQPEGGELTHEIMVGLPLLPAEFSA